MLTENGVDNDSSLPAGRASVLRRYDELAALLASTSQRPCGDPALGALASARLAHEARLLDSRRFTLWLESFTDDAVVWIPLHDDAHPADDQSLYLDDRRRLGERVAWHADPSAWGQHPPSRCVRSIGSVEAWGDGDLVITHSVFTLTEHRHGRTRTVAGRQIHELEGAAGRCRTKIVVVPELAIGLRNPSFLL